jgi:hypothetical protein
MPKKRHFRSEILSSAARLAQNSGILLLLSPVALELHVLPRTF